MTVLLTNGDSFTSCWPMEARLGHRRFGWPSLVCQHFDWKLIDKSRAGCSNYRIYRKTFDALFSDEVTIAVIFLTYFTRIETAANFGTKPGRVYQYQSPGDQESREVFERFYNGYKNYADMLRQIISLQRCAASIGKPCYFLDTFDDNLYRDISYEQFRDVVKTNIVAFDAMDDARMLDKYQTIKLLESQIEWDKFISDRSFSFLVKHCEFEQGHPGIAAHRHMANIVIDFLQEKQHGKTF